MSAENKKLSAENKKLKEDVSCLTNQNADLKHDFAEIKGVNTRLSESLSSQKRLMATMEDSRRIDALKYEAQEKELKKRHDEIISLQDQMPHYIGT